MKGFGEKGSWFKVQQGGRTVFTSHHFLSQVQGSPQQRTLPNIHNKDDK